MFWSHTYTEQLLTERWNIYIKQYHVLIHYIHNYWTANTIYIPVKQVTLTLILREMSHLPTPHVTAQKEHFKRQRRSSASDIVASTTAKAMAGLIRPTKTWRLTFASLGSLGAGSKFIPMSSTKVKWFPL